MKTTLQLPLAVLSGLFLFVGLVMLGYAAIRVVQTVAFLHNATTATGRVVKLEWRNGPGRQGSSGGYVTIFTFSDTDGRAHMVRTSAAVNPPPYQVGAQVTVAFSPADPEGARIQSFRILHFGSSVLALLGSIFAGVGGWLFIADRKAARAFAF
jgi:hypothetical protein